MRREAVVVEHEVGGHADLANYLSLSRVEACLLNCCPQLLSSCPHDLDPSLCDWCCSVTLGTTEVTHDVELLAALTDEVARDCAFLVGDQVGHWTKVSDPTPKYHLHPLVGRLAR